MLTCIHLYSIYYIAAFFNNFTRFYYAGRYKCASEDGQPSGFSPFQRLDLGDIGLLCRVGAGQLSENDFLKELCFINILKLFHI